MAEDSPQKKAKPMTLACNYKIALTNSLTHLELTALSMQLDSKTAKTSFGKIPLSDEKSQPVYGFTQARRVESDKLYMGELTKTSNMAKYSPGPIYKYHDTIKYEDVSDDH